MVQRRDNIDAAHTVASQLDPPLYQLCDGGGVQRGVAHRHLRLPDWGPEIHNQVASGARERPPLQGGLSYAAPRVRSQDKPNGAARSFRAGTTIRGSHWARPRGLW